MHSSLSLYVRCSRLTTMMTSTTPIPKSATLVTMIGHASAARERDSRSQRVSHGADASRALLVPPAEGASDTGSITTTNDEEEEEEEEEDEGDIAAATEAEEEERRKEVAVVEVVVRGEGGGESSISS